MRFSKSVRSAVSLGRGVSGRENDFASAVYFVELFSVLFDPGITKSVFGRTNRCDLAADAKHGSVLDDSRFAKFGPAARASGARRRAESEELANVEKKRRSAGRRAHDCCEKLFGCLNI